MFCSIFVEINILILNLKKYGIICYMNQLINIENLLTNYDLLSGIISEKLQFVHVCNRIQIINK